MKIDNWDKFDGVSWYRVQEWDSEYNIWVDNEEFGDRIKAVNYQQTLEYQLGAIARVREYSYG